MPVKLVDVSPLLGAVTKLSGVKLIVGVVLPKQMELPEQKRVKALLKMPRVQLVDDDPSNHEHRTSTVCSRFINEAQVQQTLLRVRAPPEAGHVLLCRQRSKLTEPNKYGPLRQEHLTLECTHKPPIRSPAIRLGRCVLGLRRQPSLWTHLRQAGSGSSQSWVSSVSRSSSATACSVPSQSRPLTVVPSRSIS